jgi:hypothetical protein
MLIGTLARLDSLIAPMAPAGAAVSAALVSELDLGDEAAALADEYVLGGEDLGEMVAREEVLDQDGGDVGVERLVEERGGKRDLRHEDMAIGADADPNTSAPIQVKKPAKKRRKKGDVFDEIFSALI